MDGLNVLLAMAAVVGPLALAWLLIGHGLRRRTRGAAGGGGDHARRRRASFGTPMIGRPRRPR
jgi:hypothetical protein